MLGDYSQKEAAIWKLAERLHYEQERQDPTGTKWEELEDDEREFLRTCVGRLLMEWELIAQATGLSLPQLPRNDQLTFDAARPIGEVAGGGQRDADNPIVVAEIGCPIEENYRGVCRINDSDCLLINRRRMGLIGHGGVPLLWNEERECFFPIQESSASAIA